MSLSDKLIRSLFPDVVREVLTDYPSVIQSVETYLERPSLPHGYRPQEVNLYFDGCWVASWNTFKKVEEFPFSSQTQPELVEMEVDGEPGLILVNGVVILNRVEEIPYHYLWMVDDLPDAA